MILGIDVSTYFETLKLGGKYFYQGKNVDPLDEFIKNGVSSMRIRTWVNPYSEDGLPYNGGTCDTINFIELSKLAQSKGYSIYLDIHYSDFWCDPAKQMKPKSWRNLDFNELKNMVYKYTCELLNNAKENNIDIKIIQIGNEITNGMLWPDGKLYGETHPRKGYNNLCMLLKEGIKACDEIYPQALKMLHLERSYDKDLYFEFFSEMEKHEVSFDIIGASFYPYWHKSKESMFDNLKSCKERFKKQVMIVETSYAFTLEDYYQDNNGVINLGVNKNNIDTFDIKTKYPFTKTGQKDYIHDLIKDAINNDIDGLYYWEPLWVPGNLTCWSSKESQIYINECNKSIRNEWSNQCLVDYSGNLNPGFMEFNNKGEKINEN